MEPMHEAALLRLAARQHGLVTAGQLASLGFTKDAILRRQKAGVLFRVHRRVYAVAGTRDTFEFRVMAAVLAAGEGAVALCRRAVRVAPDPMRPRGSDGVGPACSAAGRVRIAPT